MNDKLHPGTLTLSIAAVERDTGLSKDTLRVWERRYGFPSPLRDGLGERAYPLEQVEKLRVVKRLLDAGHRPGCVVAMDAPTLRQLAEQTLEAPQRPAEAAADAAELALLLGRVQGDDAAGLRAALAHLLARRGVARFVAAVVLPLHTAVGEAWMRGHVEIYQEHACTEALQTVLRQAIAAIPAPPGGGPRVLLTTLPGEPHSLGLLMAEALLALDGCACISLGTQTPPWDIVRAAIAYRCDIAALSFSGCMNPNAAFQALGELAAKLPPATALWAGGAAPVLHRRPVAGVRALRSYEDMGAELQRWRAGAARQPDAARA